MVDSETDIEDLLADPIELEDLNEDDEVIVEGELDDVSDEIEARTVEVV